MTARTLTDDQLADALRTHLPMAGADLRERIAIEISTTPQERRLPSILGRLTDADPAGRGRAVLLVALLALALSVVIGAVAGALLLERRAPDLSTDLRTTDPLLDRSTDLDDPVEVIDYAGTYIDGWPSTTTNKAGVYSWDPGRCSRTSCMFGWMHNGYASGDVEIRMHVYAPGTMSEDGATPVAVAGQPGFHRRIDARHEEWFTDFAGSTILIELESRAGVSDADLAEAHAVIASIRPERWDNSADLRLVFRLATDDWDSG